MATVELLLSPLPVHVRTARLVGVAAARRARLADELVDELRLAIGEACSRAVALNAAHAPDVPVKIVLRDDATGLTVEVTDAGPESGPPTDPVEELLGEYEVDPRVALAVLMGLVDELDITTTSSGTTVTLRWPLPVRAA
ncbi:MAG: anti-sigma regulatory factor [Frankiales bacterium]|nr:anti-sigma regulatory factor [Frankiales bacterium]